MKRKKIVYKKVKKSDIPEIFDYKNPDSLKVFVSEQGKITRRSRTGISARQQRALTKAVKRARVLALMPFAR